jgi:hypothetical protein
MGNLNYTIDVNVSGSAASVDAQGFDLIGILAEDAVFAAADYKIYASPAEVAADAELTTDALKAFVTAFFAPKRHPGKVLVIPCPTGTGSYDTDLDAFEAAYSGDNWYCLVSDVRVIADMLDMAAWVETRRKVCCVQSDDKTLAELGQITTLSRARTMCVVHPTDTEPVDLEGLAYMLATSPDEGVPSYHDHTLSGCTSCDDDYTQAEIDAAIAADGVVYSSLKGIGATSEGFCCDGGYLDRVISGDWLAARVEEGIAQLRLDVAARGGRIPFTDAGIAQVASVVRTWLARGVAVGHFRGDEGFAPEVTVPSVADCTPSTRALTLTARATLAGSIYTVTVNIGISS